MLNIEENRTSSSFYDTRQDFSIKAAGYVLAAIPTIELFREQIPETSLVQLIPGFYFLLILVFSFLFLVVSSLIERIFPRLDKLKASGTKTNKKMQFFPQLILLFLFCFSSVLLVFDNLLPLSLDSFNSVGERALENNWSFQDVYTLELSLITTLLVLSTFPIVALFTFYSEEDVKVLPTYWRNLTSISFIGAGIITPTIDGYTQICFGLSAVILYLIVFGLTFKRTSSKLKGISSFG